MNTEQEQLDLEELPDLEELLDRIRLGLKDEYTVRYYGQRLRSDQGLSPNHPDRNTDDSEALYYQLQRFI